MKKFLILSGLSLFSFFICGLFFYNSNFESKLKSSEFLKNTKNFSFSRTLVIDDDKKDLETVKKTFDLKGISQIKIEAKAGSIKIKSTSNLKNKAIFKLKTFSNQVSKDFKVENGVIALTMNHKEKNLSINSNTELEVFLPKGSEKIDFNVDVSFGEVELKNLNLQNLSVDIAAGSFKGKNIKMADASVKVSAGEVKLKDSYFLSLNSSVEGGSAEIEVLNASPNATVKTSAGQIDFKVGKDFKKNFTLKAKTSFGSTNLANGYEENSDGDYVYGAGKGRVVLKADLGEINVF